MMPGKFPEQIVYVRAKDDIVNGGVLFAPPKNSVKPIAIIWIHGWGVNFYSPTYVEIGRLLAERGYTWMIRNADHMYISEEVQVADRIAKWAEGLLR